jgi:hypothetical protein
MNLLWLLNVVKILMLNAYVFLHGGAHIAFAIYDFGVENKK